MTIPEDLTIAALGMVAWALCWAVLINVRAQKYARSVEPERFGVQNWLAEAILTGNRAGGCEGWGCPGREPIDLTSHEVQVVLRTIGFQLARAKRDHFVIDVAALASRIARKHPRIAGADEIEGEIMMQAAKAGVPLYLDNHS